VYSWIPVLSQTDLTPVNSAFQTHRQDKNFLCQTPCLRRIWWEDRHTAPRYLCSESDSHRLHILWERSKICLGTGRCGWVDSRVVGKISALDLVSKGYEGELLEVDCSANTAEGKRCRITEPGPNFGISIELDAKDSTKYIQNVNSHRPIKTARLHYKTNQLTLFTEIIANYCENHKKHIKTFCEKMQHFSPLRQVVQYCNHWVKQCIQLATDVTNAERFLVPFVPSAVPPTRPRYDPPLPSARVVSPFAPARLPLPAACSRNVGCLSAWHPTVSSSASPSSSSRPSAPSIS
jgi:hypothetical protein